MTHRIKTIAVERNMYSLFFHKAEQFLKGASEMFESGKYNVSASNSVHACISAADALCVRHLGKRAAGEKHSDAVNLVKSVKNTEEFLGNAARYSRVLALKSLAEYDVRMVNKTDAESALNNAEKFIEFVKRNLPEE
jgi:HEPN domain-containing protein